MPRVEAGYLIYSPDLYFAICPGRINLGGICKFEMGDRIDLNKTYSSIGRQPCFNGELYRFTYQDLILINRSFYCSFLLRKDSLHKKQEKQEKYCSFEDHYYSSVAAQEETLQHFYIIVSCSYRQQVATGLFECLGTIGRYPEKLLFIIIPDKTVAAIHPFGRTTF